MLRHEKIIAPPRQATRSEEYAGEPPLMGVRHTPYAQLFNPFHVRPPRNDRASRPVD
jgi:hypothetical protein